jgi:hypothetical protein
MTCPRLFQDEQKFKLDLKKVEEDNDCVDKTQSFGADKTTHFDWKRQWRKRAA